MPNGHRLRSGGISGNGEPASPMPNRRSLDMARTPLMSRLLHLVADFHQAEARGISVEQLRDERRLGISRRDFLKTTGVAAVGLSLARPASVPGTANASGQPPIGIMGAGIGGLGAALGLQDKGLASAVFESSTRIGGRMHSDSTGYWRNGQTSEWCGELIDSNFKTIMSLAQRFNLPLVDMLAAQPQGSQDTYYVHGHYYLYTQALQDFIPVSQTLRDQLKQAPFPTVYNSSTPFVKYLDHLSVHDWIEQYVPGGHSSDFGELLDSAYNQEFCLDTPSHR